MTMSDINSAISENTLEDDVFDIDADKLREECGVFGISGNKEAAVITALGLHSLQHR